MACASCGGGRQLTPNRQQQIPQYLQSPQRIVVTPKGGGTKNSMTPNKPAKTERTQV